MAVKDFTFEGGSYRLELYETASNASHKTMLFKLIYEYGDQKELLSKMLHKIICTDKNHGIDADITDYVENIRPEKKSNDTITTRTLAEALEKYLDKSKKAVI